MAAVQTEFAKKTISTNDANGGLKALKRKEARKEKFKSELIKIHLLNEKGEETAQCSWRIPRQKLTPKDVKDSLFGASVLDGARGTSSSTARRN